MVVQFHAAGGYDFQLLGETPSRVARSFPIEAVKIPDAGQLLQEWSQNASPKRRSFYRPRESLLEVPSNVLSPQTLKGVRPKLDDVSEYGDEELCRVGGYGVELLFIIGGSAIARWNTLGSIAGFNANSLTNVCVEISHGPQRIPSRNRAAFNDNSSTPNPPRHCFIDRSFCAWEGWGFEAMNDQVLKKTSSGDSRWHALYATFRKILEDSRKAMRQKKYRGFSDVVPACRVCIPCGIRILHEHLPRRPFVSKKSINFIRLRAPPR
ncbi:unnamed protein product [Toxocara canis]|uniref:Uncharacterized protein n=1 Tax=Toxocara canis TaxID=6265 RepID=A0A183VFL2_TOXCA|nr:unnamed protein product [Toxocara canis]